MPPLSKAAEIIWFNIEGSSDLSINEIEKVICNILALADPVVHIVYSATINDKLGDAVRVTFLTAKDYQGSILTT
jgi:cell division GTPase FtsZ